MEGRATASPHFTHARSMNMGIAVARPSMKRVSATRPLPFAFSYLQNPQLCFLGDLLFQEIPLPSFASIRVIRGLLFLAGFSIEPSSFSLRLACAFFHKLFTRESFNIPRTFPSATRPARIFKISCRTSLNGQGSNIQDTLRHGMANPGSSRTGLNRPGHQGRRAKPLRSRPPRANTSMLYARSHPEQYQARSAAGKRLAAALPYPCSSVSIGG
jgi:hypothetical protein